MSRLFKNKRILWIGAAFIVLAVVAFFIFFQGSTPTTTAQDDAPPNVGKSNNIQPIDQVAVNTTPTAAISATVTPEGAVTPTVDATLTPQDVLNTVTAPATQVVAPTATPVPPSPTPAPPAALFPVKLNIPSVNINTSLVESYLDQNDAIYVPLNEAGHYIRSSRPGEPGNMVIVGHVRKGLVFNSLIKVKLGDTIQIYDEANKLFEYKVEQIELLPVKGASQDQVEADLKYILPTTDERVTLVTCWPEVTYSNRLVVIGIPIKK